jgi:hypothetical protein
LFSEEKMKPWTARKQIRAAFANEHVRIGTRLLPGGAALRGLYATQDFAPDDYVASFHGEAVSRAEVVRLHESDQSKFEQIMEYAVATPSGGHLCPNDLDRLGAHLINHSCGPNAKWARYEQGALLVRALRPIAAGQEVTVHYGWMGLKAADEGRRHPCVCAAPLCIGTIELYVEVIRNDDGTGGPYLPPVEVSKRLLADIMNDTDANEALLHNYANSSTAMFQGAEIVSRIDRSAFLEKLREGARAAIPAALGLQARGGTPSERRLRQVARSYGVPIVGDEDPTGGLRR